MNADFKNELANKLGGGFPFGPGGPGGGIRRPGGPPGMTVPNHSVSGDASPGSLSPTSPAARARTSSGEPSAPIQDAYMEGAMLRINLNRQRNHRARSSRLLTTLAAAASASSQGDGANLPSPIRLDQIAEEPAESAVFSAPRTPKEDVIILPRTPKEDGPLRIPSTASSSPPATPLSRHSVDAVAVVLDEGDADRPLPKPRGKTGGREKSRTSSGCSDVEEDYDDFTRQEGACKYFCRCRRRNRSP